jgi:hypothetical protein
MSGFPDYVGTFRLLKTWLGRLHTFVHLRPFTGAPHGESAPNHGCCSGHGEEKNVSLMALSSSRRKFPLTGGILRRTNRSASVPCFSASKQYSPIIFQVALGVVAALSLASSINYYHTVDRRNRYNQDPVQTYMIGVEEQRFRDVIAMVPPDSVVGYITDAPARHDAHWPTNGEFLLAAVRYALAPRLVIPYEAAKKPDWVVGQFSKPVDLEQIESTNRLKLIKDLGWGVVVFRRE